MKEVVFFIESFSGGGAERVLYTILRHIDREKFDVTILVMNDTGVQKEAFHTLDFKIINILGSRIGFFNKIKYKLLYNYLPAKAALKWLTKGIDADIYVAFVEGYCTKIFAQLPVNKRKVAWVHIDLKSFPWTIEKKIFKNKGEERLAYSKFNKVIGVSEEVTAMMKHNYEINDAIKIFNPIDEERIINLSKAETEFRIDSNSFNLISVGRLTKQKGYDKLLGLIPVIIRQCPNTMLYIVGDGEEREALTLQVKKLGLQKHVILTGFLENPYSLMSRMDLFVCSSVAEGFSLVIAEGMLTGLPVVSMKCAGPCELLDFGKYGILCDTYDELAKTIIDLYSHKSKLQSLRNKTEIRASFFNTDAIVRQIENIL